MRAPLPRSQRPRAQHPRAQHPRARRALLAVVAFATLAAATACSGKDDHLATKAGGELADGAKWTIQVPDDWNGTLLVFSHGYIPPGTPNAVQLAFDEPSRKRLLEDGYALAATSFASTGWAVTEGLQDQIDVLDRFTDRVGPPKRTIAWGGSMGGMMTAALLEEHPDRFDGGVALCAPLAGAVAFWDTALAVTFGLRTLVAPDPAAQLVRLTADQDDAYIRLQARMKSAVREPASVARMVLISTLAGLPGKSDTLEGLQHQAADLIAVAALGNAARGELEERFGGNPSSNDGVDYAALLAQSDRRADVEAAYAAAGADLQADLATLAAAPRITADAPARAALAAAVTPTGRISDPLVTLHASGDPGAILADDHIYASRVAEAGASDLLRQATTQGTGHCFFTSAEVLTVVQALDQRIQTGSWPATDPATLQATATALTRELRGKVPPTFVEPVRPAPAPLDP